MSDMEDNETDDFQVVKDLITGCEDFVVSKINEVKTACEQSVENERRLREAAERENSELSVRVKVLESEVVQLKKQNENLQKCVNVDVMKRIIDIEKATKDAAEQKCKCKDLFDGFVLVGNTIFSGGKIVANEMSDTQINQTSENDQIDTGSNINCGDIINPILPPSMFYKGLHLPDPITEGMHDSSDILINKNVVVEDKIVNIFGNRRSATIQSYKLMEDLPDELRQKVEKYHVPRSPRAASEALSDVQRAYVAYCCAGKETASPTDLAKHIIMQGISDHIWADDFTPKQGTTFIDYLIGRIKNKRSRKRLGKMKELAESQKERLSGKVAKK